MMAYIGRGNPPQGPGVFSVPSYLVSGELFWATRVLSACGSG